MTLFAKLHVYILNARDKIRSMIDLVYRVYVCVFCVIYFIKFEFLLRVLLLMDSIIKTLITQGE
jgi:hypothetical protein